MTTTIALETSRGDLPLALGLGLGLGIVLIGLIALVNALAYGLGEVARRRAGSV
jgi:tungstate transport system permease protein